MAMNKTIDKIHQGRIFITAGGSSPVGFLYLKVFLITFGKNSEKFSILKNTLH
jgi:hypothetical protein